MLPERLTVKVPVSVPGSLAWSSVAAMLTVWVAEASVMKIVALEGLPTV